MNSAFENPQWLNYHHLRHFWMIAKHRSVTRAAEKLKISQSTLSEQLAELESWLGQPLFDRRGRQLQLTDAGRIALEHAETIFTTGHELITRFRQSGGTRQRVLRIGAVGPLSKNLQFDFIQPILTDLRTKVVVVVGALDELTRQLHEHKVDLVLSNIPLRADQEQDVFNHLLGEMPVFLIGGKTLKLSPGKFPNFLKDVPLFLPSRESDVRADFDLILDKAGIEPLVRAEVDDMALLRLLALSGAGLALVSKIVIERELHSREIQFMQRVPGLAERFFALTVRKRFPNAWLAEVVESFRARLRQLSTSAAR
ncbi:MAG TPA: LysR family transcriptional regulator [Candidatus Acidoferrum sp.]|nr:LysR family transcriptional regulator [Candidatus Acidoferrum sp.]